MPATITLTGTLIDQTTEKGLSNLEVQIWPTQEGSTSPLTTAVSDATGQFVVQLALDNSWKLPRTKSNGAAAAPSAPSSSQSSTGVQRRQLAALNWCRIRPS